MVNYVIVGGGVGGLAIGSMLEDVILLEKEPYLGGCTSTFKRANRLYNAGATTFAPYEPNSPIYEYTQKYNINLTSIKEIDPAIVVKIEDIEINRYRDIEKFIYEIDRVFPNKANGKFWRLIKEISDEFYQNLNIYYSKRDILNISKSIYSLLPLFGKFYRYILTDAKSMINSILGEIPNEYQSFLDNQLLIVAQERSENINFLTASLSLSYTFYKNFYSFGGMGSLCDDIAKNIDLVKLNCEVLEIEKHNKEFILKTNESEFRAKNIILNSTIFDSVSLFKDENIKKYYSKFEHLDSKQGAFILYLTIKTDLTFHHHYQIIKNSFFKNTISNSIFVSFSDKEDRKMAKIGEYSLTVSTHTDTEFWLNLTKEQYKTEKLITENDILEILLESFNLPKSSILTHFSATPKTFKRYINRSSVGGIPMSYKNFFFKLPSPDTKFNGIYNIGDTLFPSQGWAGAIFGAMNLKNIM